MSRWTRNIIGLVVLVAAVLSAVYGVDYYRKATQPAAIDPCIANLKMIAGATDTWAAEHHKTTNDIPTWPDVLAYFGTQPTCNQGGTYILVRVGQKPTCTVKGHSF